MERMGGDDCNNDLRVRIIYMGGRDFTFSWKMGCNTEHLHRTRVYTGSIPKLGRKNERIGELFVQQS